jgi:ADP-ribose pyrophosphatase
MNRGDDDRHLIETRVDSTDVFDGSLLHIRRDTVSLPDGGQATREYVVHPGAAMIVPVLPDGALLFERQFRYPLGRVFVEFPAGKVDADEDPLTTARRELTEETGYVAARWTHLATTHPIVSYSTEQIDIFLAEGLTHVGARLDAGEFLETFSATLDEALAWVDRGEITDGKTILGILLLARRVTPGR